MLPKKKRVTKDIFQTIMDKGRIIHGSFFIFRYLDSDISRYAFVAPKKIAKTAVKRNSLRRKGYNIFRLPLLGMDNLKHIAGIFFYKKEALIATPTEIKADIEIILRRVKSI